MDEVTFQIPGYDGITFHAVRKAENDACPDSWIQVWADINGDTIPDFHVGFTGP